MTTLGHEARGIAGLTIALLLVGRPAGAASAGADPQVFWTRFRAAVAANDQPRLTEMTRFPIEVKGTTDDEPVRRLAQARFRPALQAALKGDTGLSAKPETVRALIARTPTFPLRKGDQDHCLAALCFGLTPDGWKLVRIYAGS